MKDLGKGSQVTALTPAQAADALATANGLTKTRSCHGSLRGGVPLSATRTVTRLFVDLCRSA